MGKAILIVLLTVVSSSAVAEWTVFGHNDEFIGYVDSASISRAGNLVRVSSLIDYKTVKTESGKAYVSVKAQHEFDCTEGQVRKLFLSEHSETMGNGEIVSYSYKAGTFEPIQPFSILEALWVVACG
jgi:hypothetical protein